MYIQAYWIQFSLSFSQTWTANLAVLGVYPSLVSSPGKMRFQVSFMIYNKALEFQLQMHIWVFEGCLVNVEDDELKTG